MNNDTIITLELLTELVSEENFINDLSGKLLESIEHLQN